MRADVSLGPDNRSRGYGTVLLATAEDAGRAVDTFNGYSWQSRILEVRLDRQLQEFDSPTPSSSSSHLSLLLSPSKSSSVTDDPDYPPSVTDPNPRRNLFVGNVRHLFCIVARLSNAVFVASFSLPMAGSEGFVSTSWHYHACRCRPWPRWQVTRVRYCRFRYRT